jgi:hypothetical protein
MKKQEPGRFPTGATPGERAVTVCAGTGTGYSGAGLPARTIRKAPPNERTIRGLAR